ncbi:MAG: Uma2 family endonuclease [Geitlerinemataceae cyanobacterium]
MTLQLAQLDLQPGQRLRAIDWRTFKALLLELGEPRNSRIAYQTDILEIGRPTSEHEVDNDPPPDLAIEIDATSKTRLEAYEQISVRERWIYDRDRLSIHVFAPDEQRYHEQSQSPTFPELPIIEIIETALRGCRTLGRSPVLRQVRNQLRSQLG